MVEASPSAAHSRPYSPVACGYCLVGGDSQGFPQAMSGRHSWGRLTGAHHIGDDWPIDWQGAEAEEIQTTVHRGREFKLLSCGCWGE